jgi:hypothetical protein
MCSHHDQFRAKLDRCGNYLLSGVAVAQNDSVVDLRELVDHLQICAFDPQQWY